MVDDCLHAATVRFLRDSKRVVHHLARDPLVRSADERLRRLLEEADQLRPGPRPFEVGGIGHRSLERVAANGLFPNRSPQAASRSDRSFGSSAQGPARPFATAGGSISRSARRSRVRPYPSRGSPIPRNTGTLVRKNFGGISAPNKRAYVRSMTGWQGAWDPTTQPAIPRRNKAAS